MQILRVKPLILLILLFFTFGILLHYTSNRPLNEHSKEVVYQKQMERQILDDDKDVINPHDYKYMLNPGFSICGLDGGKRVTLLAMVNVVWILNVFKISDTYKSEYGKIKKLVQKLVSFGSMTMPPLFENIYSKKNYLLIHKTLDTHPKKGK